MSLFCGDGGETAWLDSMNLALAPLERDYVAQFEAPRQPVLFIVGAPRSGTTLLSQLLIRCCGLGYISNLAARFWNAPALGLKLAASLSDGSPPAVGLDSDYGQVAGYEGPHEFGHFWQRWFDYGETHRVEPEKLAAIDHDFLRRELAAVEAHYGRPTLYKNLAACGMNLDYLARELPTARFVYLRRDPLRVACSLLAGRLRHGGREHWFSVRPPDYPTLRELPWPEQIAGQVASIEAQLERSLHALPGQRWLALDYMELLVSPAAVLEHIAGWLKASGGTLAEPMAPVPELHEPPPPVIDAADRDRLAAVVASRFPASRALEA